MDFISLTGTEQPLWPLWLSVLLKYKPFGIFLFTFPVLLLCVFLSKQLDHLKLTLKVKKMDSPAAVAWTAVLNKVQSRDQPFILLAYVSDEDYDTSDQCSTPASTDQALFQRQRDQGGYPVLVAYYVLAELKQDDHRLVMAFISVDILHTGMESTRPVLGDVVGRLGLPDATVVIQLSTGVAEREDKTSWGDDEAMLSRLSQAAGGVLLLRVAVNELHLILRDGTTVLVLSPVRINAYL